MPRLHKSSDRSAPHLLYIGHMPEDSALAAELASALGDLYRLTTNLNSPNIDVAFFLLTHAYIVN